MQIPDKNRVLLISHAFPPEETVEVHRVTKFAEYLPEFGWTPYVLTANKPTIQYDEGEEKIPDTIGEIRRVSFMKDDIPFAADAGLRWTPTMVRNAIEMVNTHHIDVIVHTAPVFLPLSGIGLIKSNTEKPYIIDFRDPWTLLKKSDQRNSIKSHIYDFISKICEPYVFRKADSIIVNSPRMRDIYAEMYPNQSDKLNTIYNGYDPQDHKGQKPSKTKHFQIIYPGKFRDNMQYFFEGFGKFVRNNPETRFIHYGRKELGYAPAVQEVVDDLDLNQYVEFRGYTDQETVFEAIRESNLGVAVTRSNDDTHIPAKLFDYIACDVPILCIDEKTGASHSLLSPFEHAYTIERNNSEEVYSILRLIQESSIDSIGQTEIREHYNRKYQTEELATLLSETAG